MDKDLTCTMCNQLYRENNVPRLLPKCGHSFCESCIKSAMEPINDSDSVKIVCPDDGMQMIFEDRDINNFPKNIALVKMLAGKDNKKRDESFKDNSLNESNIVKHSVNDVDEEDKQLITVINESTKGTDGNHFNDNPSGDGEDLDLNMEDTCLIHQKPLEIVCIRDKTKICSTCAIFGDHKGHEFKSMDEVAKDKEKRCDGILSLMDLKENLQTRVTGKQAKDDITKSLITRKQNLCKEVKDKFCKITDMLKSVEKRALDKITKNMSAFEDKLLEELKIPQQLNKKYVLWEERAYRQIKCLDGDNNFEEQLQVLDYEKTTEHMDIMTEGNKIVDDIEKAVTVLEEQRSEVINSVTIQFNNQLEKKIPQLVFIRQATKKPTIQVSLSSTSNRQSVQGKFKEIYEPILAPPKRSLTLPQQQAMPCRNIVQEKNSLPQVLSPTLHSHNPDDFLLEAPQDPIEEPVVREIQEMLDTPYTHIKEPEVLKPPSSFTLTSPTNHFMPQSPCDTSRKMIEKGGGLKESSFVFDKLPAKKRPKLKLPEKYQKIFDAIVNDQLEIVDFTNAELGDLTMFQIVQHIRGKKVKTLKLIRNKLTDQGLDKMLPYLGGIITLNLSQNLLTDRFIDHLLNHLPKMPMLKSIILSQNKIRERSVKTRLEEVKKYDVLISL